ncbi:PREDICTED: uncharacterized protein LOC109581654 [Amphimedon queenslandica]|uniref:Death domain-containing protein n=1 Tax=Amphimedon queenslandica TaxID=400682 RepID=A0A1X7VUL7_AMPQE|nr:PREDICTED: uncharacterized protein LOC109581654 [Amphimedon queenslandica]|eukprot:XP_019851512.1 PREDICTED: uncharacterized protein LOC109581654 [Amphimedon queenslandica]
MAELIGNDDDISKVLEGMNVKQDCLLSRCEDSFFLMLTQNVAQYDVLGPYFGMSQTDLIQIKRDNDTEGTRMMAMLWKWRTRNGSKATYSSLISNFLQMNNREIVELVVKHLQEENKVKEMSSVAVPSFTPENSPGKYLNWSEMSDNEKERVRNDLIDRSNKVRLSFASLLVKIVQSFKRSQVSVEELKLYLCQLPHLDSDPSSLERLEQADDIAKIFRILSKHYSWYNHELLGEVVDTFGTEEDQALISKYNQDKLLPYLECSIFEIPPCLFDSSCNFRQQLCLKLPDSIMPSGSDVKLLQEKLAKRLDLPVSCLQLTSYTAGCVELYFALYRDVYVKDLESIAVYDTIRKAYFVSVDVIDILFSKEAPRELKILRKLMSPKESTYNEEQKTEELIPPNSPGYADGGIGGDGNGMEQLLMLKVPENTQKKDSTCSYDSAVELEDTIYQRRETLPFLLGRRQLDQRQVSHKLSEHTKTLANKLTKVQEFHSEKKVTLRGSPNQRLFTVIGGRNVGIFVSSAPPCDAQIMNGDQILDINGHTTYGMSLYDATSIIERSNTEDIKLTLIENKSKYLVALGHLEADSFYIKSMVNHEPSTKDDARLQTGTILRVINTYLFANHWLAWMVDERTGLEFDLKRIPSPYIAKLLFGSEVYVVVDKSSLSFKGRTLSASFSEDQPVPKVKIEEMESTL